MKGKQCLHNDLRMHDPTLPDKIRLFQKLSRPPLLLTSGSRGQAATIYPSPQIMGVPPHKK